MNDTQSLSPDAEDALDDAISEQAAQRRLRRERRLDLLEGTNYADEASA